MVARHSDEDGLDWEQEEEAEFEDDDEEEEEDEDEDEEDEKPLKEARKDAVYDVMGIHEKLEDIAWPSEVDWIHPLSVTIPSEGPPVDAEDDLAREMSFYTLALEGAQQAYLKLQALGIPFLRPEDYYAEMVKSDKHMLKVKDRLLTQQKEIEEEQERRKAREAKKFAKEVQVEKLKERAKQKKQDIESVKKWRKMRKDSDYTEGEEDFPVDMEDGPPAAKRKRAMAAPWDRSGGKEKFANGKARGRAAPWERSGGKEKFENGKARGRAAPWDRSGGKEKFENGKPKGKFIKGGKAGGFGKNKSRDQRNAKFGHGGRKGLKKKNTADSAAGFGGRPQKKQRRG